MDSLDSLGQDHRQSLQVFLHTVSRSVQPQNVTVYSEQVSQGTQSATCGAVTNSLVVMYDLIWWGRVQESNTEGLTCHGDPLKPDHQ